MTGRLPAVKSSASRPQPRALVDSFGRTVTDLRISVTDRCNFRCGYCMPPEGLQWLPRSELLSFEEIERVARVCVERFAISSIRLTGGEPTIRADLAVLVERLAALSTPGPSGRSTPVELAMTTNGTTLVKLAGPLKEAGLARINVSLDSLRPERFAAMTGRDQLDKVLAGIDAALAAGFAPLKVNAVVIRGMNDDEVVELATFGRQRGVQLRFIEFMPLDAGQGWRQDLVVPASDILAAIKAVYPLEAADHGPEPAQRYRYLDGAGEIGVIPSVTQPFCESCDRIRVTAEGQLRTCLFALDEHDLRARLRSGESDEQIAAALEGAVAKKWSGHRIGRVEFIRPSRSMSQIGG